MSVSLLLGTIRKPMFPLRCSITPPADVPAVGTEHKTYLSAHAYARTSIMPLDKQTSINLIEYYMITKLHTLCTHYL